MSEELRDQVEDPRAHEEIETARNLPDAANAGQSLEGYASINGLSDQSEIARIAYKLYEERERNGQEGTADGDWFRAEAEASRDRKSSIG